MVEIQERNDVMLKAVITDADFLGGEPKLCSDISRYGARGIILNKDNLAGMILMSANGFYKLPGGGIQLGERESDAFIREVSEETGCVVSIIAPLGTVEEHKSRSGFCQFSYAFIGRVEGECKPAEKLGGISMSWMSLKDASALMAKSLEMCKEYKMRFMLKREQLIIDYALKLIESGEISIT